MAPSQLNLVGVSQAGVVYITSEVCLESFKQIAEFIPVDFICSALLTGFVAK